MAEEIWAWSYSQPTAGSTSPSTEIWTLKLWPCMRRHLWPSGALGRVWAASNWKSFVRRARISAKLAFFYGLSCVPNVGGAFAPRPFESEEDRDTKVPPTFV